ncbi:MAG: hypothetical protein LLF89_09465, partial [Spirochaetaceae bacterium]|nr:hypothetical protein [Spirochaetaceae bacterium]
MDDDVPIDELPKPVRRRWSLIIGLVLLVFVALSAGVVIVQNRRIRASVQALLESVTSQKSDQLLLWRKQQISRANETMHTVDTVRYVSALVRGPNPDAEEKMLLNFSYFAQLYKYSDSLVVRTDLTVALSTSSNELLDSSYAGYFAMAASSHAPVMTDMISTPPNGKPGFAVIIPLFEDAPHDPLGTLQGYIVHFADADQTIFPIVEGWPLPDEAAECILVKPSGDQVLFLSNARFLPTSALSFSIPGGAGQTVETMAVFGGKSGFVEGMNYHQKKVLAHATPIEGTRWILISEIEAATAFASWRWSYILLIAIIFAALTASLSAYNTTRQRHFTSLYRKQFEAEKTLRAAERKFNSFMDYMPSIVIIKDSDS